MSRNEKKTQAMPHDGLKGAPDGVNSQADNAMGANRASVPRPDPRKRNLVDGKRRFTEKVMGHGGQSEMAYYGPQQLGDDEVEPGGNPNAGTKKG